MTFTRKVLGVIQEYGMVQRSLLPSFEWRTLVEAERELPALKTASPR